MSLTDQPDNLGATPEERLDAANDEISNLNRFYIDAVSGRRVFRSMYREAKERIAALERENADLRRQLEAKEGR